MQSGFQSCVFSSWRLFLDLLKQQAVLEIPWDFSKPLRIEIDLLAGPKCTTDTIEADPGDILDLRIESVLSRSAACS